MDRLKFTEEGHRYTLDGVEIPSNTTLLQAAGLIDTRWFQPEHAQRGKEVHKACWFLCEGDLDWASVRPDYVPYVEAFALFLEQSGFKVELNEVPVWSAAGYATTPDLVGILNGRRVIINIKTGSVEKWVGLQLAGEKYALTERILAQDLPWTHHLEPINGRAFPEGRFALQVSANGKYKLHKEFTSPMDEPTFLGIVSLHHWRKAA